MIQATHLGDTAGIVGDGAVSVHSHGDTGGGQHADSGQSDAVQTGNLIGNENTNADQQDGHGSGHHAHGDAADDGGSGAGLGLLGDLLHGVIIAGGVDLGDDTDDQAHDQTRDDGDGLGHTAEEHIAQNQRQDHHDGGGNIGAHLQSLMGVGILIAPDKEAADDGSHDTGGSQDQGEQSAGAVEGADHSHTQSQRGHQSAHVGLKQVSAHAGHVAHVVAHVISDHGRVPGVIFGDAGLDLAHQVSAHVGSLGVDTAAHTGKQRDGGSTQREAGENLHVAGEGIDGGAAQQAQANHAHTHDGTTGEGDAQGLVHAAGLSGGSGTDIGLGSHVHTHITGAHREDRADQEATSGEPGDEQADQHEQHRHENDQDLVLREEKCPGAITDVSRDLLHPFRTGVSLGDRGGLPCSKQQSQNRAQQNYPNDVFHSFHSLNVLYKIECLTLLYHSNNTARFFQVNLPNEQITLNKFYVLPNFFLESFQIFVFIFHLTFIKYANYQIFLYILSHIFFKYT